MPTATAERTAPGASIASRATAALTRPLPAASFVAFRVAFGLLVAFGSVRFLLRGWVGEFYTRPEHHLTYAGFEWVRPMPTPWMHLHVLGLAVLGLLIAAGVRTRVAAAVFAVAFAYTELIDAALYLNHYWFVTLAAVVLAVAPAPRAGTVPALSVWALRSQLAVVYVFAGIAKVNPDWLLDAEPMRTWLAARTDRPVVGPWLGEAWVAYVLSWAGAVFDLTIVGWLSWRRSRPVAYVAVVGFHLATAVLFQIGVFPWVMIALTPVFFAPDWPDRVRLRWRGTRPTATMTRTDGRARRIGAPTWVAVGVLAVANVALPLRHYLADGNVRFDDDGYYLAWRVMLTERTGFVEYRVTDRDTGETWRMRPDDLLEPWQVGQATTRPDLVLATAHLVATTAADEGRRVSVRADSWVAVNGRSRYRWIDPDVDLAALPRDSPAAAYVLAPPEDA